METEAQYERLGWKTFWIFVSEKAHLAIIVGLLAFACALFTGESFITHVFLILFLLAFGVTLLLSWVQYVRFGFIIDADALRIKRGIIHLEEMSIPYRQIQDIDIERNLLNQLTATSKLVILTAGSKDKGEDEAESEGVIPIIDKNLASRLQKELSTRANIQKVVEVSPTS